MLTPVGIVKMIIGENYTYSFRSTQYWILKYMWAVIISKCTQMFDNVSNSINDTYNIWYPHCTAHTSRQKHEIVKMDRLSLKPQQYCWFLYCKYTFIHFFFVFLCVYTSHHIFLNKCALQVLLCGDWDKYHSILHPGFSHISNEEIQR